MSLTPISLYLHIPFCSHRCHYCDFNTYTSLGDLKEAYVQALCTEIQQVAGAEKRPVRSIFFGGGTPSLLSAALIRQILTTITTHFDLLTGAEVTMEANPETVDKGYLATVRGAGINRLSFGAQSAVESELKLLGREHTFERVAEVVEMARQVGFDNYNIDLIYGVPGQTVASWEHSVRAALDLQTTHLSLYCLTIEPGTPMHRWLNNGQMPPPDPDLAADQYELTCDLLAQAGFEHYEISNWAKPGRASVHNLAYWRNDEYLGFGSGAHGHAAGIRYQVVKQPRTYIRRLSENRPLVAYPLSAAVAEKTTLTRADQMGETMMMGLRLLQEGVTEAQFTGRFGQTLDEVYGDTIEELLNLGLLQRPNGRLTLTEKGTFVSNQVFYRFV